LAARKDKRENDGHHIPVSEEKLKELLESVFQRITPEHGGYRKSWFAFQREAESEFEGTFP
jgi:hypothetical protein